MTHTNSKGGVGKSMLKSLLVLGGVLGLAGGGFYSPQAAAAAPPANTKIVNQATASYTDGAGVDRVATSNPVETLIQQVGSFTLAPNTTGAITAATGTGYTKSGAAGATIYNGYTLTNSGNGTDIFTLAATAPAGTAPTATQAIYADVNQDGQPDNATPVSSITLGAGGVYTFVVGYTIPGTASGAWSNTADVSATAGNNTIGYPNLTLTRTDTINLTTGAAFSANKSITAPAVTAPATAPLSGTWPSAVSSGPVGTRTVYTISYVNNGAANGAYYVEDTLPAGLTYVTGTAVWSGAPGIALDETATVGGDPSGIEYEVTGSSIKALVSSVLPGQTGTLSFVVDVNTSATIGTGTTSNIANFVQVPDPACTTLATCPGTGTLTPTTPSPFTVLATRDVILKIQDLVNGTPNGAGDTVTITSIVPGSSVKFTFPVINNGNASDTFDMSVPSNTFPTGTLFTWFQSDGVTPLQNTAGSAAVDTGPVAAGATVNVVLQVYLPITAPTGNGLNLQAVALATSVGTPLEIDAALAVVTDVLPGVLDLQNQVGSAVGPGTTTVINALGVTAGGTGIVNTGAAASAVAAASAAGSAVFELNIVNHDTGALKFNLAASSTNSFPGNLPAGWTVSYFTDAAATAAAVMPVSINAGATATLYAKVTPAVNAASGAYDVFFQAESTAPSALTGVIVRDYKRDQLVVAAAGSYSMTLTSAGALQVSPGGSATFAHTLTNTGNYSCGANTIAVTDLPAGWTYALYLDNGSTVGVIDGTDTLLTTGALGTLAVSASQNLLVRVFAPGSAVAGDVGTAKVTVTDTQPAPNCGTVFVADITTVVATGQMQVTKYQSLDAGCLNSVDPTLSDDLSAKGGDCIVYKVVAINAGTDTMTAAKLNDVVPSYTTWAANQPAIACESSAGAVALAVTPATGAPAGTAIACGTAALLPPGGTITLRYAVKIDN